MTRKTKKRQAEEEKDVLLKAIGQFKVENDFLKNALRWGQFLNVDQW